MRGKEIGDEQTSALHSKARRKNAADAKCFPTDSASFIWVSQYGAYSSLSNLHLLQLCALKYGVPNSAGLMDDLGVRGPSSGVGLFLMFFSAGRSWSWKRTTDFFASGLGLLVASLAWSRDPPVDSVLSSIFEASFWGSLLEMTTGFGCFKLLLSTAGSFCRFTFVLLVVPKARFVLREKR